MAAPIPEPGRDEEQPPRDSLGPEAGQPPADAPGLGAGQQTPDGRGPDSGQAQDCWRGPGWAWVEGSADSGPVPEVDRPGIQPDGPAGGGLPAGLDYQALLDGLAAAGLGSTSPEGQGAEVGGWLGAARGGGAGAGRAGAVAG